MQIPLCLVTGFLGSGKTTFLKKILELLADSKKIGIVQNEFAGASIDGKDLRSTGKPFEIIEINKGSVFCVCLLSDFVSSLTAFADSYKPDMLFIEASGADPIAIAELMLMPEMQERFYLEHIWCVLDASIFPKLIVYNKNATRQIRIADTVFINKTDKIRTDTSEIRKKVALINRFATIVETQYCDATIEEIFRHNDIRIAISQAEENKQFTPSGRTEIVTGVIRSNLKISFEGLSKFIDEIAPQVYRMKGFVNILYGNAVNIQSCFGETRIMHENNYYDSTELIALSESLDPRVFSQTFRKYAKS